MAGPVTGGTENRTESQPSAPGTSCCRALSEVMMPVEFFRVAIVNRGEPAMRFIHAIREFNLERGTAIQTLALFTEPDRRARFVREADEAFDLGAATFVDPADGQRKPRYLDFERLEAGDCRVPGGCGVGGVGIRRGAAGLRRAVRPPRRGVPRSKRARDAPARRQDLGEAAGRAGGNPRDAVGRRGREQPGRRVGARAAPGLPGPGQGGELVPAAAAFDWRERSPICPPRSTARGARRAGFLAIPPSSSSDACRASGTSRCRCSATVTAPRGRLACATAPCSAVSRS